VREESHGYHQRSTLRTDDSLYPNRATKKKGIRKRWEKKKRESGTEVSSSVVRGKTSETAALKRSAGERERTRKLTGKTAARKNQIKDTSLSSESSLLALRKRRR